MTAEYASIRRDPETKSATLTVALSGDWSLYAGKNADEDGGNFDVSPPLASGTGPGEVALPDAPPGWSYFALRNGEEIFTLAERQLPMAGGYNFRDLGGFRGADGKRVVWGKFFRTDGLGNLTDADLAYLASVPVVTIVDFRTVEENLHSPDRVPATVKNVLHLPIAPGYLNPDAGKTLEDYESPDEFMLHMYRDLAEDAGITATYRQFFGRVQNEADIPLIFHCSAGKDRTGLAAAYILTALGVDRETILTDYETSNAYLGDKYAAIVAAKPYLKGLFTVKKAFLRETFTLIEKEHGAVSSYLEAMLDVDIAAMRRRFLV